MAAIIQPASHISTMLYSSLLSRQSYTMFAEAGPSTSVAAGRRLASPRSGVVAPVFHWASDSSSDNDSDSDDDDDDDYYRGRSSYRRPVPFALPTIGPSQQTRTILPETVRSPHATFAPIAIPPSPLQLPSTSVDPLYPDRPGESLISIRALSVDSLASDLLGGSRRRRSIASPTPTLNDDDAVPVSVLRRSSSTASLASDSSTDWDGFSDDEDEDDDIVGPNSPPMFACDEAAVVIRRGSDESELLPTLQFNKRRTSIEVVPKTPPPAYSLGGLTSSLQPDLDELSFLSSAARSRSIRVKA